MGQSSFCWSGTKKLLLLPDSVHTGWWGDRELKAVLPCVITIVNLCTPLSFKYELEDYCLQCDMIWKGISITSWLVLSPWVHGLKQNLETWPMLHSFVEEGCSLGVETVKMKAHIKGMFTDMTGTEDESWNLLYLPFPVTAYATKEFLVCLWAIQDLGCNTGAMDSKFMEFKSGHDISNCYPRQRGGLHRKRNCPPPCPTSSKSR